MPYTPLGTALFKWESDSTMSNISQIPGMQIGDRVLNNTDTAVVLLGTIARPGEVVQALSQFIGQVVDFVPEDEDKVLSSDLGGTGIGNCIIYNSKTKILSIGAQFENVTDGYIIGTIPARAPIPTTDRRIAGFGLTTTGAAVFGYINVGTGGNLTIHLSTTNVTARYMMFGGMTYLG